MITAKEARALTKAARKNIPMYNDIYEGRKTHRCSRFTINEHIYFEFWSEHEWEFTIYGAMSEIEAEKHVEFASDMTMFFHAFGIGSGNLTERMEMCKRMASALHEKAA